MNAPSPDPGHPRRGRAPYVVGALVVAVLAGAGAVAASTAGGGGSSVSASGASTGAGGVEAAPVGPPSVRALGASRAGVVRWDHKLRVTATNAVLTRVSGTGGAGVAGSIGTDGTWTSRGGLVPSSAYALVATLQTPGGETVRMPLRVRTNAPSKTVEAALSPGDDRTVGVGQPVIVRLDRSVDGAAARKAVEARLRVTTRPAQQGAWRWMSDSELHYRGPAYWEPGTRISVVSELTGLRLPDGVWGDGRRTTSFAVNRGLTTVVDVAAKTMTVSRDGTVLRRMKASMGRPGFDTRGGNFLVLEKHETKVMDGSTLAVPQDYSTEVKHAVRITNSGTFTHGAPWSVASQGVRNVSHGCINLSPADAEWYFDRATRGDVVKVVNAEVGPTSWDAGSQDWNMTWAEWRSASDGA